MLERIAFIGGGVMAEAIVRGILDQALVPPSKMTVSEPLAERRTLLVDRYSINATDDNAAAVGGAEIVVLATKPQQLLTVLASLRGSLAPDQTVVSIIAGTTLDALTTGLGHERVIRVMPNTPAQIGAGMSVWTATPSVQPAARDRVGAILRALGRELYVEDEKYLDMATAINGSGPAYVFLFIEAMIDAAVHLGFTRPVADELVTQTVLGAARMARESGEHPAHLRNLVTSPGGTTAAALAVLEEGRLRTTIDRAVFAAYERGRILGH